MLKLSRFQSTPSIHHQCHNLVLFFAFRFIFFVIFHWFIFYFFMSHESWFFFPPPHFVSFCFFFCFPFIVWSTPPSSHQKQTNKNPQNWWPNTLTASDRTKKKNKPEPPKNPTHQAEPSGSPQEVKCYSTSSTSILVRWLPPPIESQNGIITQYAIQYAATEGEDTGTQQIDGISPQSSQYLLENLDKWTEYRVTVTALTDVGAGPESLPQLIRTEEDGMCLLKPQLQINSLPPLNI